MQEEALSRASLSLGLIHFLSDGKRLLLKQHIHYF